MATLPFTGSWIEQARQRFWRLAPGDREPVVLRHSRIYILPTRRGLAVIATLVIMLLTAMNYALSLGYALTFLAGGMVAAALLATFRNLAGIAASPVAAGEAFAGGEVAFTLALASGRRGRNGIVVTPREGQAAVIDLPADATRPVVLAVAAPRRGPLALGRVTLSSDYPLGLWGGWAYVHFPLAACIYPAPETAPPPLPAAPQGIDAQRAARAADAELGGVREYERGDPQNRIAWKAVARGAGWYTKQFEGGAGGGAVDLDWAELPPGLDDEKRLSRLTAWVLAAERETRAFGLRLPGIALPPGQGAGHRRAALVALASFGQRSNA
ncbi:MAG: DUF58 domain-containing protein [Burkholderiales bacterium]|jgi:uncharacterized protein (DUF58 family)